MNINSAQKLSDGIFLLEILKTHETKSSIKEIYNLLQSYEKNLLKNKILNPSLEAKVISFTSKYVGYDYILGKLLDDKNLPYSRLEYIQKLIISRDDLELKDINRFEKNHRTIGGNALRAAVLGGNDGLTSNLSLVMGVAGASMGNKQIILIGIAGLLAGALSMALGEWISVKSSAELSENLMKLEKEAIEKNPESEKHEIMIMYMSKGIEKSQAEQIANEIIKDKQKTLQLMINDELRIDPDEIKGNAIQAAFASFILFAIGALIPIFPYFFFNSQKAMILSIVFSGLGLFLIGAVITLFTGKKVFYSGARQVIFGLLAASITFGIGRLIGVATGG